MTRKGQMTNGQINDQVAADALRNSGQHGKVPTHSAMQNQYDPDADATDAAPDDGDFDEDRTQGY